MLFCLQLRDLRVRDSENVVTYGGFNLQKLAAAVPEEECELTNTDTPCMAACSCHSQTVSAVVLRSVADI